MTEDIKSHPLLVIGLDAGDPVFIEAWVNEGHLPAIASVMKNGSWGRTCGPELVTEHGVWISLLSGISRGQHGYYYFRQLKPGTYELEAVTGLDVNAPPFWTHLKDGSKKALIIDAADTRLTPGLKGIQVANWASHHNWDPYHFVTASEPPEIMDEIRRKFGPRLQTIENHKSTFEEDVRIYRRLLDNVRKKGEMCRFLIKKDRFDLSVMLFAEAHAANHQFWKYHPRNNDSGEENELTHAIRNIYRAIDEEISLIIEQYKNANVCIVSSIGMEDDFPNAGLGEAFCRKLGYQAAPQANGVYFRPIDIARKLLPDSVRVALSRRLSRERREQLVADGFRSGTDWKKTTAFSLPVSYTSFIRVNLRGREPEGIVENGREYDTLTNSIIAELKQIIDPVTNEPAALNVYKTTDLFNCGPHESLPDILVEWRPGKFMERVVHPKGELTQQKPEFFRRSDHSSHGFFALSGPSVGAAGNIGEIELIDIAPTFMSLMGERAPGVMKGRALKLG